MFDLYRKERSIFRLEDYGALMEIVLARGIRTVLEFGPGISTLAFIEAGVERITSLEYLPQWRKVAAQEFAQYPQVTIGAFDNAPVIDPPAIAGMSFDLAFVDSPIGEGTRRAPDFPGQEGMNRFNTVCCALKHAPIVMLHDAHRPGEQTTLKAVAAVGHKVEVINTRKGIAVIQRAP